MRPGGTLHLDHLRRSGARGLIGTWHRSEEKYLLTKTFNYASLNVSIEGVGEARV